MGVKIVLRLFKTFYSATWKRCHTEVIRHDLKPNVCSLNVWVIAVSARSSHKQKFKSVVFFWLLVTKQSVSCTDHLVVCPVYLLDALFCVRAQTSTRKKRVLKPFIKLNLAQVLVGRRSVSAFVARNEKWTLFPPNWLFEF